VIGAFDERGARIMNRAAGMSCVVRYSDRCVFRENIPAVVSSTRVVWGVHKKCDVLICVGIVATLSVGSAFHIGE
jgi:hypothetical protein